MMRAFSEVQGRKAWRLTKAFSTHGGLLPVLLARPRGARATEMQEHLAEAVRSAEAAVSAVSGATQALMQVRQNTKDEQVKDAASQVLRAWAGIGSGGRPGGQLPPL